MIFFLFLHFFSTVYGDCLEFTDKQQFVNECSIKHSVNHSLDTERYYPQCLQCRIQTLIQSETIQFEEPNQCLDIQLQCIQLIFNTTEIFEDFFRFHQSFINNLFNKDNGTNDNTLHVIIKENTLEEINIDYIKNIFEMKSPSYRALFFELDIPNSIVEINPDLINLTRLSMKIILNCGNEIESLRTIYVIHNHNITLDSDDDLCSIMFIHSSTTISSIVLLTTPLAEVLSISQEKLKDIVLIIVLLTGCLLCGLITSLIYCFKRLRRSYSRLPKKTETSSELTISEDINIETPSPVIEKPRLSLKVKRPPRGMRAIQLLDNDI